ncbi:MAG: cell division protein FtsQ/DivIB [Lactobacillaceae bacterium]
MKTVENNFYFKKISYSYIFKTAIVVLLNIIGIIGCVYFLLNLNLIRVVNVNGNNEIPAQEIIDASKLKVNQNVFQIFFNQKKIKRQIKKNIPQINQISLELHDFNSVKITVTEFQIIGYIQKNKYYRSVFTNGNVDHLLKKKIYQNRPIFDNFKTKEEIQRIAIVFQKIPASVKNNISEIKLTHSTINPNQITLNMNDGNKVIGDLTTISKKIVDYSFLTRNRKEKLLIDLEVGTFVRKLE